MSDRRTLVLKNRFIRQTRKHGLKSNIHKKRKTSSKSVYYKPSVELQYAFRSVMKKLELKDEEIDEVRKAYFLHFKYFKEIISKGHMVPVNFFKIGKIMPNENFIKSRMSSLSRSRMKTNRNEREIQDEFFKLLKVLFNIYNSETLKLEKKGFKNEGFKESIQGHYQQWTANFAQRGVTIKTYEDWERNGSGKGFFI